MRKGNLKKACSFALALCLLTQMPPVIPGQSGGQIVQAATVYNNAKVASVTGEGDAVIRGGSAAVIYDSDRKSNVLSLGGGAFGSGWLQNRAVLPDR